MGEVEWRPVRRRGIEGHKTCVVAGATQGGRDGMRRHARGIGVAWVAGVLLLLVSGACGELGRSTGGAVQSGGTGSNANVGGGATVVTAPTSGGVSSGQGSGS